FPAPRAISRRGSSKCCGSSRRGARTGRSRPSSRSARRPWIGTSATSSRRSTCRRVPRRRHTRFGIGSCRAAQALAGAAWVKLPSGGGRSFGWFLRSGVAGRKAIVAPSPANRGEPAMETAALTAARELSPLIQSLRDETDAARNIAAPIVERLRDGRLCRLALAKGLAGGEVPLDAALDVYETLAYADASVAWVAWNNSLPCLFGRFLASDARATVFEDP